MIVLLGEHDDLDAGHIGIHGHEVVGKIVVDVARIALVDLGSLQQRRGHAPDQAAHQLAARGARIHDPACSERADQPGTTDLVREAVDADLDELGAEGVGDLVFHLMAADEPGLPGMHGLERVQRCALRLPFAIFLDHADIGTIALPAAPAKKARRLN